MTANDLADRLEQFYTGTHIDKAAETLRQQAQEIAKLKQIIDANNLQSDIGQLKKELALQKLSDISQEIENEPVAWMSNGKEFYVQKNYCPDFIPLYTHPNEDRDSAIYATGYWKGVEYKRMRELNDEEILELSNTMPYADRFDFARAILMKASEK